MQINQKQGGGGGGVVESHEIKSVLLKGNIFQSYWKGNQWEKFERNLPTSICGPCLVPSDNDT